VSETTSAEAGAKFVLVGDERERERERDREKIAG